MRRISRILIALTVLIGVTARLGAADLGDQTRTAYEKYAARATTAFLQRFATGGESPQSVANIDGEITVRPASEDGIIDIAGGLVHHWIGSTFLRGVTLEEAIAVSQAYDKYPAMYKEIVSARAVAHEGNTYRVQLRVRESAMGRTVVLDISSHVVYTFPRAGVTSSVATADEIHEVVDAGTPRERVLPAGHDNGYLWRAATLSALVKRDDGVAVHMETIGLSRGFPPMLGWIIEPVARRLGARSVERSIQQFSDAVRAGQRSVAR